MPRLAPSPAALDIWYKTQRVLRTALATLLSLLAFIAALSAVAPQILAELSTILPESWIAWLTAAIAFVTAVASAITRIMAIPRVNAGLVRIGLGSVPRSAVAVEVNTRSGSTTTYVLPDPKAADDA